MIDYLVNRLSLPLLALLVGGSALAQIAVETSPPNARYRVLPGDVVEGVARLRNPVEAPVSVSIELSDFVLLPDGSIQPLPVGSVPASAAAWMTASVGEVTLAPGELREVRYRVAVPPDAAPGTRWATLLFRSATGAGADVEEGTTVRYAVQVAHIVYVDVGAPELAGRINAIAAAPGARAVTLGVQNTGDGYMTLRGRLELRTREGTLVETLDVAPAASLPGGMTTLSVEVPEGVPAGDYLVAAILETGGDLIAGQAEVTLP